jgi:hypothetical protein
MFVSLSLIKARSFTVLGPLIEQFVILRHILLLKYIFMFIPTKCATPFGRKSIKLYWSETRQITKGRKSGKYVYAGRSNGGLEYISSLGKGRVSQDCFTSCLL